MLIGFTRNPQTIALGCRQYVAKAGLGSASRQVLPRADLRYK
jgi:hypothetical protein